MAQMEQNLLRAEKKMEKSQKKQGGILNMLTSSWAAVGATAVGVGYAMIRASPSLSYAMEEITYRFEDMLAVLGEEFAPILEDVVIPLLDQFMPIVKELAPMIGEAVGTIVEFLTKPEVQAAISQLVEAFGKVYLALWDLNIVIFDALMPVFELLAPLLIDLVIFNFEIFAGVLGTVIGIIEGPLTTVMGAIGAILTPVVGFFQNIIDKVEEEGGLIGILQDLIGYIEGGFSTAVSLFGSVVQPIIDAISTVIDIIKDPAVGILNWFRKVAAILDVGGLFGKAIDWIVDKLSSLWEAIDKIVQPLKDVAAAAGKLPGGGIDKQSLLALLFGGLLDYKAAQKFQAGSAIVPGPGLYMLHGGEEVNPPQSIRYGGGGGGLSVGEIIIQIDSVQLSQDMDVYDFADKLSRRFKEDVQREWY